MQRRARRFVRRIYETIIAPNIERWSLCIGILCTIFIHILHTTLTHTSVRGGSHSSRQYAAKPVHKKCVMCGQKKAKKNNIILLPLSSMERRKLSQNCDNSNWNRFIIYNSIFIYLTISLFLQHKGTYVHNLAQGTPYKKKVRHKWLCKFPPKLQTR